MMINRQVPGVAVHQSNDATRDIPLGTPVVSGNIIAMPQRPPAEEESEQVYVFGFPVEHMEDDSVVPLMRNVLRISIAAGLLVIVSHGAKYEIFRCQKPEPRRALLLPGLVHGLGLLGRHHHIHLDGHREQWGPSDR